MRGFVGFLIAAVTVSGVAGCVGSGGAAGEFAGVPAKQVLAKLDLQYYWNLRADLRFGERIERLYRLDENLYCLTNRNRLLAFEAMTGRSKWSRQVAPVGKEVFDLVHADQVALHVGVPGVRTLLGFREAPITERFDAVLVSTVYYVLVIDRANGNLVRNRAAGDFGEEAIGSSGCADQRRFYAATPSGRCFAFDMDSGLSVWTFGGYSPVTAPLRYFNGTVYMANHKGQLITARAGHTRKLLWSRTLGGAVTAPFHAGRKGVFVPCHDGRLYAFGSLGGNELWEDPFICDGRMVHCPQVSGRSVFLYSEGDTFYAVSLTSGKKRWDRKDARRVLAVIGRNAYVLDRHRKMLVMDEVSGKVKWELEMTGFDLLVSNTEAPAIFAAKRNGSLYCIRPKSAGMLTVGQLKTSKD